MDKVTKDQVLSSLEEVGKTKAVGYLPIKTITSVLGESLENLAQHLTMRGLNIRILHGEETCIKSGAIFVFAAPMVQEIIEKYKTLMLQRNFGLTADHVITRISQEWFDDNDPIMPFIRELYNDG